MTNKVIEEVTLKSFEKDQSLSANVMKSIVDKQPNKIKSLSDENKQKMISQTIQAAKVSLNQSNESKDLSSVVAEIIVKTDDDTASSVLKELNNSNKEQSSDLTKSVFINLTKNKNFEEKLKNISNKSVIAEDIVDTMVKDSIETVSEKDEIQAVKKLLKENKFMSDKIIDIADKSNSKV